MSAAHDLTITAPTKADHLDGMCDLLALVFSDGDPMRRRRSYRTLLDTDDRHYRWEDSRVGLLDGQVATHVGVLRYTMRLGGATIPVAGIAAVATRPFMRGGGLMRRTFGATVDGLRSADYAMSVLFGIDDFYGKFGYTRAWREANIAVALKDIPDSAPVPVLEAFSTTDLGRTDDSYNRWHARIPGSAVRPGHAVGLFLTQGKPEFFLWDDGRGKVLGHIAVRTRHTELEIMDQSGEPAAVLAAAACIARERYRPMVRFTALSWKAPLAAWLRHSAGARTELSWRRDGGPMARTVNLKACLNALTDDLRERYRVSAWADTPLQLVISDGREEATIQGDSREITIGDPVPSPDRIDAGDRLAALLLGADAPTEILAAPGVRSSGKGAELASVLFPEQYPMLSMIDRF